MERFSSWTALLLCTWAFSFGVTSSECPPINYGVDCLKNCSVTCLDQRCDHETGECDACPPDKTGALCLQDCPLGYYGTDCALECKECAGDGSCHSPHGVCTHGCKDGYQGDACDQPCGFKNYGPGCQLNCSQFCKVDLNKAQAVCYHTTGVCLNMGCQDGYEGPKCDVQPQKPEKSPSPGLSIGIGVTTGLMAVIIIVAIISIYCYNKRVRQPLPNEDGIQQNNEHSKVPSSPLSDGPPSPRYDELSSPRSPGPSPGYEELSCFRYEKPPSFLFEGQYSIKNKAKEHSQNEETSDLQRENPQISEKEQTPEPRQEGDQISQKEESPSSSNNEHGQNYVSEGSSDCHQNETADPKSEETASSLGEGPQNHPKQQVTHSLKESPSRSQDERTDNSQIIQNGGSPVSKLAQGEPTNQEGQSKDQDVVIDCPDVIKDEHGDHREQKDQDKSQNRKERIYQDKPETFVTYM